MKPVVAKRATPAAAAVLRQATALAPKRNKASDGILPSAAHLAANPTSDHNSGYAVDLTHDPKHGIDCAVIFRKLQDDKRVKYMVFNKKMWQNGKVTRYTGPNPHSKHIHISIKNGRGNNTSPWFWWMNQPKVTNQIKAALKRSPKKK